MLAPCMRMFTLCSRVRSRFRMVILSSEFVATLISFFRSSISDRSFSSPSEDCILPLREQFAG